MIKFIMLAIVLYIIYLAFFRKPRNSSKKKNKKNEEVETLIECKNCSTFISNKEAIISGVGYFCSNKCLDEYLKGKK